MVVKHPWAVPMNLGFQHSWLSVWAWVILLHACLLVCVRWQSGSPRVLQLCVGMNMGRWGNRQRLGVVGWGSASRGGDGHPVPKSTEEGDGCSRWLCSLHSREAQPQCPPTNAPQLCSWGKRGSDIEREIVFGVKHWLSEVLKFVWPFRFKWGT